VRDPGLGVRTEPQVHLPRTIVGIWLAPFSIPAWVIPTGAVSPDVINLYPGQLFTYPVNSIYADIASVASVNGELRLPSF